METKVYNRETSEIYVEKQYKGNQLKFLYETVFGRLLLRWFIAGKLYSKYNARKNSKKKSIQKIQPFVTTYGIDMTEYPKVNYQSFNEFFVRRILPEKRVVDSDENAFIAVADAKLMFYKIEDDLSINIKNSIYTVKELLQDNNLAQQYKNGICLIFRLTVDDYHHYCYPDEGKVVAKKYIKGRLHTVGPISAKSHKVYAENCREYFVLDTVHFNQVVQIEVGALLVGRIMNRDIKQFCKGEEKGYFEMGGSTLVLLLKEGEAVIAKDIVAHSAEGIETKVKMGEKIGEKG